MRSKGAHLGRNGRGTNSRVITDLNQPWELRNMHELQQMRAGLPDGSLSSKGKSVAEMVKKRDFLPISFRRGGKTMNKIRFATVWMDGCSGCHMSFLTWMSGCWKSSSISISSTARSSIPRSTRKCGCVLIEEP